MKPTDVRLDRLNNGAPVLNSHNSSDLNGQIGVVERSYRRRLYNGIVENKNRNFATNSPIKINATPTYMMPVAD